MKSGSLYAYVNSLIPEYESVKSALGEPSAGSDDPVALLQDKNLRWSRVARLETWIVEHMDTHQLRLKAGRLRELYRDLMICAPGVPPTAPAMPGDDAAAVQANLRAEVQELLSQFHLQLGVKQRREQLRSLKLWCSKQMVTLRCFSLVARRQDRFSRVAP